MFSIFVLGLVDGKFVEMRSSELPLKIDAGLWKWQANFLGRPSMASISVCNVLTSFPLTRSQTRPYIVLVPIATRHPLRNVHFEIHNVNQNFRWTDNTMDLVHARYVAMAVGDFYSLHSVPLLMHMVVTAGN